MYVRKLAVLAAAVMVATGKVISPPDSKIDFNQDTDSLYVGDSLICNDLTCYPKVFEAAEDWQIIKPLQQLPGGLDIRVNLETGLKEARLLPSGQQPKRNFVEKQAIDMGMVERRADEETGTLSKSLVVRESEHEDKDKETLSRLETTIENEKTTKTKAKDFKSTETNITHEPTENATEEATGSTTAEPSKKSKASQATASEKAKTTKSATSAKVKAIETGALVTHNVKDVVIPEDKASEPIDPESQYEFTTDFKIVKDLVSQTEQLTEANIDKIESKLDDLMEFAHDYRHGLKIITHEFKLLRNISLNDEYPISMRELGTRIITSCMRNNPPVVALILDTYPEYITQLHLWFAEISSKSSKEINSQKILIKRYLSILDELSGYLASLRLSEEEMVALKVVYSSLSDKQIKIKILELISRSFHNLSTTKDTSADETSQISPYMQNWAHEFSSMIQDNHLDEFHIRKFFNSLHSIKTTYSDLKLDPSFINWLAEQYAVRNANLRNGVGERDMEQDIFDTKFIQSRHLVFGNRMAHNIKHDEL